MTAVLRRLLLLSVLTPVLAGAVAPPAQAIVRSCAWTLQITGDQINALYPDEAAKYWIAVVPLPPGGKAVLHGRFPARAPTPRSTLTRPRRRRSTPSTTPRSRRTAGRRIPSVTARAATPSAAPTRSPSSRDSYPRAPGHRTRSTRRTPTGRRTATSRRSRCGSTAPIVGATSAAECRCRASRATPPAKAARRCGLPGHEPAGSRPHADDRERRAGRRRPPAARPSSRAHWPGTSSSNTETALADELTDNAVTGASIYPALVGLTTSAFQTGGFGENVDNKYIYAVASRGARRRARATRAPADVPQDLRGADPDGPRPAALLVTERREPGDSVLRVPHRRPGAR